MASKEAAPPLSSSMPPIAPPAATAVFQPVIHGLRHVGRAAGKA